MRGRPKWAGKISWVYLLLGASTSARWFRRLLRWHRRIGIVAAIVVINLVITGIFLNHTSDFNLDQRYVSADVLLDWYKIGSPTQPISYESNGQWILQLGHQIYLDGLPVVTVTGKLTGVIYQKDFHFVAFDNSLVLVTKNAEVVERMTTDDGIPAPLTAIAIGPAKEILLRSGASLFEFDPDGMTVRSVDDKRVVDWRHPANAPQHVREAVTKHYRGTGLTIERVLLDLHSGRLFGRFGVYFVDAATLLLLFLSLSGAWLWYKTRGTI